MPLPVALTFDDGPWESGTRPILELLNASGIQATFSCGVSKLLLAAPSCNERWPPGIRSNLIDGAIGCTTT